MDVMPLADRLWPVLRRATDLHTWVYRASHGLVGHRLPGAPPMLLLEHIGARTGKRRVTPLVYVADGANGVIRRAWQATR